MNLYSEIEFKENLVLAFGFPPDAVDLLNHTPVLTSRQLTKMLLK